MDATIEPNDIADVVVVGAGLAGLAAAAVAAGPSGPATMGSSPGSRGRRVVLVDVRSDEHAFGGRARTDQRDGFALNQGPRALYRGGQARAVLGRLGLDPQGGAPPTSHSFGWRDGHLDRLPDDGRHLVTTKLLSPRSKGRVAWLLGRLGRIDAGALGDRSMAAWITSLDLRPDAHGLVTMLTRVATYTADLTQLSADAGVRQVQLALIDGVDYLDGGWQQLVDGLVGVTRSRGVQLRAGARLVSVAASSGPDPGWMLDLGPAGPLRAATVILALGSPAATRSVLADPPAWSLGSEVTAACLDLGLRRAPERAIVFGIDQPVYLSTHTPSARLAPAGRAVVHVMRYGARDATRDRAQLWDLAQLAGIERGDVLVDRFLHRMVVTHALPRPGSGLAGRPPVEVAGHPGLFVAGDWVGGEGLLADASLASAERAATQAVQHLDHRPQLAGSAP
jgi:phytoene dehydrogenase-like protein